MSKEFSSQDERFMKQALELAGKGKASPLVGCVVVKDGVVLSSGFYEKDGAEHAEASALSGLDANGATVYVTLEPCVDFEGKRTDPCADSLMKSGVSRVVVAMTYPHKEVSGRGLEKLKEAGIKVDVGLLEEEASRLNEIHFKNVCEQMPFIALKMGSTLDGKIATASGASKYVTGEESQTTVHELRSCYDAVLTTAKTVLADDAHLGVRHVEGRDPLRVIIDRDLKVGLDATVYRDSNVLVLTETDLSDEKVIKLKKRGAKVVAMRGSLKEDMREVFRMGVTSILVEAGSTFASALIKENLVDKVYFFTAPRLFGARGISAIGDLDIGAVDEAIELNNVSYRQMGRDMMVEGYL